jgi:hypothetical protein
MLGQVAGARFTEVEVNNSTAAAVQPNHQAETFLATTDQRANRRATWLVKLSTTHRITQALRLKPASQTAFATQAMLRTPITMPSTAQVQPARTPTSIILAMSNMAKAIPVKATSTATNEVSYERRKERC